MLEWKKIGESCKTVSPPKKLEKELYGEEGLYPIIDQGQKDIVGYTFDESALIPDGEYILFGDHTRYVKYHKGVFAQGADGLKILRAVEGVLPRYLYFAFANTEVPSRGYSRHWSIAKELLIPIPSFSEQSRIVGILDTFTASIENLKQQIAQRRKQYAHYSNNLLKHVDRKESIWKKLSELADIFKGPYITKKDSNEGEFPVIMGGQKVAYYIDRYNSEGESIVISRSGINAGFVSFWNQPIFVSDGYRIDNKEIINKKYLFYFLKKNEDIINSSKKGAGVPHIQSNYLLNFLILVPSLSEQQRIVSILDTFEASIANLEQQLAQRERQYEYYRNKLLTFE